jgi:hypothetical protein
MKFEKGYYHNGQLKFEFQYSIDQFCTNREFYKNGNLSDQYITKKWQIIWN